MTFNFIGPKMVYSLLIAKPLLTHCSTIKDKRTGISCIYLVKL